MTARYPTKAEIREMLDRAGTIHMVHLTIPRRTEPRSGQRVRLLGRSGPLSREGTKVLWARGECTAWWSTEDLREWARPRRPTRAELEEFVDRVREVNAISDDGPCVQALCGLVYRFDRMLDQ